MYINRRLHGQVSDPGGAKPFFSRNLDTKGHSCATAGLERVAASAQAEDVVAEHKSRLHGRHANQLTGVVLQSSVEFCTTMHRESETGARQRTQMSERDHDRGCVKILLGSRIDWSA